MFLTIGSVIWLVIELRHIRKTVTIDQLIDQVRRQKPSPTVMKLSNITIHNATYSAEGKSVDVTAKIKELVSQNIIEIPSSNKLGGDPIHGKVKAVFIALNGIGKIPAIRSVGNHE